MRTWLHTITGFDPFFGHLTLYLTCDGRGGRVLRTVQDHYRRETRFFVNKTEEQHIENTISKQQNILDAVGQPPALPAGVSHLTLKPGCVCLGLHPLYRSFSGDNICTYVWLYYIYTQVTNNYAIAEMHTKHIYNNSLFCLV